MHEDLCPYTIYSLLFYLLFPLIKIGQFIQLPNLLNYIISLSGSAIFVDYFTRIAAKSNCVTFVIHSPTPDHPHSKATTIGVIVRSALLGILSSIGLSFINNQLQAHFVPLGIYLILLSSFHLSEYFVTSLTNPSTLNLSSFLIDQSREYVLATSASLIEYIMEAYFFPEFKKFNIIAAAGLVMALFGELIRKMAMFTAGTNFSHSISSQKSSEHYLVSHGIYGLMRHPSYAGWFYWAIGTQILLQNPICAILFAIISLDFFKERIQYEEATLVDFFGTEYKEYRKRVGLWMPLWSS